MSVKRTARDETAGLRAQIEALQSEREQLIAGGPTLQAAGSFAPAGKARYKFKVVGRGFANGKRKTLPPAVIHAPDESEAIRIYCLAEESGGRLTARKAVLEPSSYAFVVACLSPGRVQDIKQQYERAGLPGSLLPAAAR